MNGIEECIRKLNGLLCDEALKDVEADYVKLVRFENGVVEVVNMPICRTKNILAVMPVSLIGKFQTLDEKSHPGRCYPKDPTGKS